MNWKDIQVSENHTFFEFKGTALFDRKFLEVLKFHDPGIAPVKDETGSFHIDDLGHDLYPNRFDRTFGFYNLRAAVIENGCWFHINGKGQSAYSARFAWAGNYQENVCTVRDTNHFYYHIDTYGNKCYDSEFAFVGDFKDGVACVKQKGGFWRHILMDGSFLHSVQYLDLGVFHKGFSIAKDEKGWCHINKSGIPVYTQRYLSIEPFYNGFALATNFDGLKIILSETGKEIMVLG